MKRYTELNIGISADARTAIREFLEKVYNEKRLHSALDYRSPVQFERTLESSEKARISA